MGEEEEGSDNGQNVTGEEAEAWPDNRRHSGSGWSGWSQTSWRAGSGWPSDERYSAWRSQDFEPTWDVSQEIFISEFLAGFLLLHRASLDAQERANVLAAIRGQFSTETVGRALREQWSDDDLVRRDRTKMGAAYVLQELDDPEDEAMAAGEEFDNVNDLDDETKEAFWSEQDIIDEAMAAIKVQKATLREARWKQKQMKLGRSFYPPREMPRPSSSSMGKGGIKCFHCGGPHKVADCPKKGKAQSAQAADEAAEVAFLTEEALHASVLEKSDTCLVSASSVKGSIVEQCYGIIDSGATASLGSVEAMEAVMEKNIKELGNSKVDIDLGKKPTFKFGNGHRTTCLSTAKLGMMVGSKPGQMEIHVHNSPGQAILECPSFLRRGHRL